MRFAIPSKFVASSLLITLVLCFPFNYPKRYPAQNKDVGVQNYKVASTQATANTQALHSVSVNPSNIEIGPTSPTQPAGISVPPALRGFIHLVSDGQTSVVRGLFVTGKMALRVVQQPANDWSFVSAELGDATQFQRAALNGVIGLLAHNYLSGRTFYRVKQGDRVEVVYGDGTVKSYQVSGTYRYQKIDPADLSSSLVDLSNGVVVSSGQVFERFYNGADHLTLQTCLEKDGLSTWGLYFVVALPMRIGF